MCGFVCGCQLKSSRTSEIHYIDLEHPEVSGGDIGSVKKSPLVNKRTPDDITEYGEIDQVKTQALANMKKEVETERKFSERSLDG